MPPERLVTPWTQSDYSKHCPAIQVKQKVEVALACPSRKGAADVFFDSSIRTDKGQAPAENGENNM